MKVKAKYILSLGSTKRKFSLWKNKINLNWLETSRQTQLCKEETMKSNKDQI